MQESQPVVQASHLSAEMHNQPLQEIWIGPRV